jgi:hypothetical protein
MLNSRLARIPISSSTIDQAGVPQLSICGEQTVEPSPAQVAGFISEWWPTSNRNPRPDCLGIRINWLAALYWLGVFLVALGICRRPVQAAIATIGSIAGAYLLISFWR